ncbi:site-2 protease family protein [Candidatus Woesearchaeota archaeon]|nr:site-2 protease family protein [Candidatus Woesearchaeota archaeon]
MRGARKIFRVFGIDIKLHYSWWFVFALLAYALSTSFFPHFYPDLSSKTYWIMGVAATLLLFVSVLLHELTHSLVAKMKKINVESITLFFFGGVAELPTEDLKAWTEFWMALSGPVFSLVLAGVFYLIHTLNSNIYLTAITFYLYQLNFILAIFNLLPGYPLDGGRVFRALLTMYYKDIKKATWVASKGGKFVGGALAFLGLLGIVTGSWNGLWFIFLGGFLYFIAGMSYDQVVIKDVLMKVPLLKLVDKKYSHFSPEVTFDKVIERFKKTGEENFIVKKGQKFLGIIDLRRIGRLDKRVWSRVIVRSVMISAGKTNVLTEKDNSYSALRKMTQQNLKMLPLLRKDRIVGVVYNKSLSHQLVMKLKYGI